MGKNVCHARAKNAPQQRHCVPVALFQLVFPLITQDGSRAGRERKKTVSFSSSLSEKKISSAADCIHSMVGPLRCDPLHKI